MNESIILYEYLLMNESMFIFNIYMYWLKNIIERFFFTLKI